MSALLGAAGFHIPHIDYTAILPELIMIGGAVLLLGIGALRVRHLPPVVYSALTGATGVAGLVAGIVLWDDIHGAGHGFVAIAKSLAIDGFSTAFVILASAIVIVSSLLSNDYL